MFFNGTFVISHDPIDTVKRYNLGRPLLDRQLVEYSTIPLSESIHDREARILIQGNYVIPLRQLLHFHQTFKQLDEVSVLTDAEPDSRYIDMTQVHSMSDQDADLKVMIAYSGYSDNPPYDRGENLKRVLIVDALPASALHLSNMAGDKFKTEYAAPEPRVPVNDLSPLGCLKTHAIAVPVAMIDTSIFNAVELDAIVFKAKWHDVDTSNKETLLAAAVSSGNSELKCSMTLVRV